MAPQRARPATPLRVAGVECRAARAADRETLRAAERFVRAALRGKSEARPPLAPARCAPFTASCRRQMDRIPLGARVTYAELARRAGRPRAARAAGRASATNTLPLFIPCHRVVASRGRLGGFSAGLCWKAYLLEAESRA
jgi:methylated-DNA-[protein]-cysteine S-methyltransferase